MCEMCGVVVNIMFWLIAIEEYQREVRRLRAYNTRLQRHIRAFVEGVGNVRQEVYFVHYHNT